jgi:hypothetical protein
MVVEEGNVSCLLSQAAAQTPQSQAKKQETSSTTCLHVAEAREGETLANGHWLNTF